MKRILDPLQPRNSDVVRQDPVQRGLHALNRHLRPHVHAGSHLANRMNSPVGSTGQRHRHRLIGKDFACSLQVSLDRACVRLTL
jgi:hypothetical protein